MPCPTSRRATAGQPTGAREAALTDRAPPMSRSPNMPTTASRRLLAPHAQGQSRHRWAAVYPHHWAPASLAATPGLASTNRRTSAHPTGELPRLRLQGWDAGVRSRCCRDRISFTVSRYAKPAGQHRPRHRQQRRPRQFTRQPIQRAIANANVLGDLSPLSVNARGMQPVPSNYLDTASRKSKG